MGVLALSDSPSERLKVPCLWGSRGRFHGHDERRNAPSWLALGRRHCLAKMGLVLEKGAHF